MGQTSKRIMKKHIPNTITCCNLICGCIAVKLAFQGNHEGCFLFIILGAVFDFFDGFAARLLKVSSPIGKELDSLADCITFGFAPATLIFFFLNEHIGATQPFVPYAAFVLAAFSALRLAKFNLDERQAEGFIGLPTPACALFWASLFYNIGADCRLTTWTANYPLQTAAAVGALLLLSCWILVSEVPMFALKFKSFAWGNNKLRYAFIAASAVILALCGWGGFAPVILLYVILSVLQNIRKQA